MLNLKLFAALQGSNGNVASLLLRPGVPGRIQFFLMSSSVNYQVVLSGSMAGELEAGTPSAFDISLASIVPLLEKNQEMQLSYRNGVLCFEDPNKKFFVEPLCVAHLTDDAVSIAERYMRFSSRVSNFEESLEEEESLQNTLLALKASHENARIQALSSPHTGSPFGEVGGESLREIDKYYSERVSEVEKKLETIKQNNEGLSVIDCSKFRKLANAAAKYNTTIAMCNDFAVVGLQNSFLIQKINCDSRVVSGKLFQKLLAEKTGRFYNYQGDMVFCETQGKGDQISNIVVFFQRYLPNINVDSSLVTRGSVHEKYTLNLKGMLQVVSVVLSKFPDMSFDMGGSRLIMSNSTGEQLVYNFDVEDAKTLELNKLMRGEAAGEISMATIPVPREIQTILSLFRDDFTVYVKKNKVIFQSGELYAVFGR